MTINELQNNVIEEFADFDDWMDKYALLIDLGNSLPPLEAINADNWLLSDSPIVLMCRSLRR